MRKKSATRSSARTKSPAPKAKKQEAQSQSPPKLRNVRQSQSQSQMEENEIAFQKNTWVAFVDLSHDKQTFKLAYLLDNMREQDEGVLADVYQESAPLTYTKQAAKQNVFSNSVICDLAPTEEKAKRGAKPTVHITKQMANKANKLMDSVVQALENETESEDEDDDSEEEDDETPQPTQKGKKAPPSKTTKSVTRAKTAGRKKASDDDEMEEDSKVEVSKTSKSISKTKALKMPQVGQKRARTAKKEQSENESNEDESESSEVIKKLKVGSGKEKMIKVSKQPKAKKMPEVFKKGKWNPDIELAIEDRSKENKSNDLFLDCCIRCNNKNAFRAAVTENKTLLKKCIESKQKISSLVAFWSAEVKETSLEYIALNNNEDLLEILVHPNLKVPAHSTYEIERDNYFRSRVGNPQYLINFIDSGTVSHMAYGARVRKIQMTRGNRQGNNAFLEYQDNPSIAPNHHMFSANFLRKVLHSDNVTVKTLQQLFKVNSAIESHLQSNAWEAVRGGNRKLAHYLIKQMQAYPNWGFNQLHVDVLEDQADLGKILKVSVAKKANTNRDITPLHCSCINPNPKFIKLLLDANPDFNIVDNELRKPVHYAAACVGPEPLKVLIQAGAGLIDMDNQKMNCLHIAAAAGRAHNVRTILETNAALINTRTKKSMTPLALACKYGHVEAVKVLLEFKGKVNAGCGALRMTPLIWAAAYGHYELVEFLLANKGRVLGKDKYKRSALTLAARNGHSRIVTLLLQNGSEWDHPDSSMNTPLHYAAAYGWIDIIGLLLKAGANVNAANSWKITPINIAMLLNHNGCVKRLLEEPNVDVNGKDEKGRTLIMLSLIALNEESADFVSFLLKKGADPNIKDLDGQTSLHYLAKFNPQANQPYNHAMTPEQNQKMQKEQFQLNLAIQREIAQILIQNKADLAIKDDKEKTAFSIALENDNSSLLEFLQNKVSLNKDPSLFFAFGQKIFNLEYQKIFETLLKNDPPTPETINYMNDQGFTPFLHLVQEFTTAYLHLFTLIQYRINQQSFLYQNQTSKYNVSNADLFDKFADQNNWYNYNQNFSQDQKNTLTKTFMDKIIVHPFIQLLKSLVAKGANPHAQIGKLKRFRDEEQKQKLLLEQAEGKLQGKMEKEEPVKKRIEKMDYRGRGKMARKAARPGFNGGSVMNAVYQNPITVNENQGELKYDFRNGEKVLREYGSTGLRNAIHLLVHQPQESLLNYLLSLKIDPDAPDYDETTPINLLSLKGITPEDQVFLDKLIDLEVRVDYPNIKGRTPFLNYFEQQHIQVAYNLLALGANVNQMDEGGLFALKYSLLRRNNPQIQELLDKGANINLIDNKGRNLLHHAINMSSATADATFETEQFLIERGVEINLRDKQQKTPLHYAFVKISDYSSTVQIDPIETVSSLCGFKHLELDVPDKWMKTPLHYASQRGASICAMYLITRGANKEAQDIYGNTPLGVGLMNRHYNYGIILIQKEASVLATVFREDWEKLKKQWKELELKAKGLPTSSQPVQGDQQAEHKTKQHQFLFAKKSKAFDDYGDEYGDEYDEEDEEDDYGAEHAMEIHHNNVFNQQNVFGGNVFAMPHAKAPAMGFNFNQGMGSMQFSQPAAAKRSAIPTNDKQSLMKEQDEGVSMFKLSIRGGQQGLAYLMLDNGYDLMLAMQDAMDEKKFMLVLTLLSKNPNDEIVQQKNKKGQNLFHILSQNASSCSLEHLTRICETLKKRGVDMKAKDNFGRNALHYAVISQSLALVRLLLDSTDKYDPNEVDSEGHTPMSYCLRGLNSKQAFYNALHSIHNIFLSLGQHGADVNVIYPEDKHVPAFSEEDLDESMQDGYDKKHYFCTPLIHQVRLNLHNDIQTQNIMGLMEFGAKLNQVDSDGRDPLMYAIMNNNEKVVKMLLDNAKGGQLNVKTQDKAGKTAVHYVINPIKFGSYENTTLLRDLFKAGFNLNVKDNQGKTPAQYAQEQESGVLLKELAKLTGMEDSLQKIKRATSVIETSNWPAQRVDFELDAEQYTELAEQREKAIAKENKHRVPVDKVGHFEKSYQVYYDQNDHPWDVYLTKVDLKNGIYGDYVFYKMQLLYDTNRDLYVVFTRWGRIGENGMHQRTPFADVEEAKKDFKTIFKQKTGGNDFERLDTFGRIKKKYNIAHVNYISFDHKDYLAPFEYDKCPKSKLNQALYDLFEEIANVTMYQKAMTGFGLDTEVLPFSGVKKETLVQARQILMEIQEKINEDIEISKEGVKADFEKLTAVKEKVAELTSRYYELIPLSRYRDQIAPPLGNQHLLKQQYDNLDGLSNIEYATKVLLGALLKQKEINPVDYVYHALNLQIEALDKEGPEFELLHNYIKKTDSSYLSNNQYVVGNIFKFQRKGEAELIQKFKDVPNHFLLFHGSAMFNFIGILSQGLRIAPPEAPATGYMFGKGLYFADMFEKSIQYAARGYQQQDSFLMLLCETALGKQKELMQATPVEKLDLPFHSVKGVGRRGPDYKSTIVMPNGVKVPYGDVIDYELKDNQKQFYGLQHNEYIVYNTQQVRMQYLIQIVKKDRLHKKL